MSRIPRLAVVPCLVTPAITGIFRPRILLPANWSMPRATLRHVLLHELAHWSRRDLWWQGIASAITIVHWFNPLIWWANIRLRAEAEAAADAWVLRRLENTEAHAYGDSLLKLLERTAFTALWILTPGIIGMAESKRDLRQRIRGVVEAAHGRRPWHMAGIVALALLSIVGLTKMPAQPAPPPPTQVSLKVKVIDEQKIPVANAEVNVQLPSDAKEDIRFAKTNAEGFVVIENLPSNVMAYVHASQGAHMAKDAARITLGKVSEVTIELSPLRTITYRVHAKGRSEPLTRGKLYIGSSHSQGMIQNWISSQLPQLQPDNTYQLRLPTGPLAPNYQLRIEVDGYATWVSGPLGDADQPATLDVALDPEVNLEGTVVNAEGKPAGGAVVWFEGSATYAPEEITSEWIRFLTTHATYVPWPKQNSENVGPFRRGTTFVLTDDAGHFKIKQLPPAMRRAAGFFVAHPDGVAQGSAAALTSGSTLHLDKFCTIHGKLLKGDKPAPNTPVHLDVQCGVHTEVNFFACFRQRLVAVTNDAGEFTFPQVLPASDVELHIDKELAPAKILQLSSGQNVELTLRASESAEEITRQIVGEIAYPANLKGLFKDAGVMFRSAGASGKRFMATIDDAGHYTSPPLPMDDYTFEAYANIPDPDSTSGRKLYLETSRTVHLKKTADNAPFDLGMTQLELSGPTLFTPVPAPSAPTGRVEVLVQDTNGRPLPGAIVQTRMLRFAAAPSRGLPLVEPRDFFIEPSPIKDVRTDYSGHAIITFPRDLPYHPVFGAIDVKITKEGFTPTSSGYLTNGSTTTVRLAHTTTVCVHATYNGATVWPQFLGARRSFDATMPMVPKQDWLAGENLPDGEHTFLVTARTSENEWLFSDQMNYRSAPDEIQRNECELHSGISLSGKIKDPSGSIKVHDGWVIAYVDCWLPFVKDVQIRSVVNWQAWTPVHEDGTYSFAGLPTGYLQVMATGTGWVSHVANSGALIREQWINRKTPSLTLDLETKATVSRRFRVTDDGGLPVKGATVRARRMSRPSVGALWEREEDRYVRKSEEKDWNQFRQHPLPGLETGTDDQGEAVLSNLPEGDVELFLGWSDATGVKNYRREILAVPRDASEVGQIHLPPATTTNHGG